ncbi:hypothetical protein V8F33_008835 [Rhypophila sp. PSN 637]
MASTAANTNGDMSTVAEIEGLLRPMSRYKDRSYETSTNKHLPILQHVVDQQSPQDKVSVVLLGDSMLERMTTTGLPKPKKPNQPRPALPCLGVWPPPTLMKYQVFKTVLRAEEPDRLRNVLNLGVGGDKFQNVAYRVIGDDKSIDASEALEGYVGYLTRMKSVKLWVVHAGTNNLRAKTGFTNEDIDVLSKLLRSLLLIPSNEQGEAKSRILLTGMFPRTDAAGKWVQSSNEKIEALAKNLNRDPELAKGCIVKDGESVKVNRIIYLSPSTVIGDKDQYFVDKVHLNREGYEEWMKDLVPFVMGMLDGMRD